MYQYLTGRLIEKLPTSVVLDVNGVGYLMQIPVSTYAVLPPVGESVRVLTHFVVREDAHALYGFFTEEERQMFRLLLSVSGIGPRMAVTILSGVALEDLKHAIIEGALPVLTAISGIGRKTAERIVVELREKVVLEERRANVSRPPSSGGVLTMENAVVEDTLRALMELGYRRQNAKEAIQKVLEDPNASQWSISDFIKASLKHI